MGFEGEWGGSENCLVHACACSAGSRRSLECAAASGGISVLKVL